MGVISFSISLFRCLAHVVNLATQAFLTEYSKSKHFDPQAPESDLLVGNGGHRDEIGLIRTISVKVQYNFVCLSTYS